jgi:hypothetical protein
MSSFADNVAIELKRARSLHPPISSAHEGYAVILEELDEFWEEVRKRRSKRDALRMYDELVQVAAMAQRVAEDTVLLSREDLPNPFTPSPLNPFPPAPLPLESPT